MHDQILLNTPPTQSREHVTMRKALTWGCIDHYAAGVTYLMFPVQVCFSSTSQDLVFPVLLFHFQSKMNIIPHVTLNFDIRQWHIKLTCYLSQRSLDSYRVNTHTHTHSRPNAVHGPQWSVTNWLFAALTVTMHYQHSSIYRALTALRCTLQHTMTINKNASIRWQDSAPPISGGT